MELQYYTQLYNMPSFALLVTDVESDVPNFCVPCLLTNDAQHFLPQSIAARVSQTLLFPHSGIFQNYVIEYL